MPNKKTDNKKFDYLYFARAYLLLAFLGTEELLKCINNKNKNKENKNSLAKDEGDELVPDFVLMNNYLVAPVLYNLKHSIEIFLKVTSLFFEDDFDEKHDIKLLFSKIKGKLNKLKLDKENKNEFIKKVGDLEKLIIKYHKNIFLENKISSSFTMEDIKNDVFRYPDNKAKINLDFDKIFPLFTVGDIKEIQQDMKKFNTLFYDVGLRVLEDKYGPLITVSEE